MDIKYWFLAAAIFFITGSFIEYFITHRKRKGYYKLGDTFTSIKLMLTGLVVDSIIKLTTAFLFIELYKISPIEWDYSLTTWILCFLAWDFIFYCMHYLEHNVRLLWATHVNHHSSPYLNLSTSLRSGIFKSLYRYFFFFPIAILGFPPIIFLSIYLFGKFWAFWSHSRLLGNWGFLENILVTPTLHNLHHSCNNNHLNKNFGEILIVWDRIFGTYVKSSNEIAIGVFPEVDQSSFKHVVFHEINALIQDVKSAGSLKHKLMYVFAKPGWKAMKSEERKV